MSDDQQLIFEFVADESGLKKGYDNVETQAKKTATKISDSFAKKDVFGSDKLLDFKGVLGELGDSVPGIVTRFGKLGLAVGAVAVAGLALKETFDLALEGERINQINTSFEILASQAGANVLDLRAKLQIAAGGVIDMEAVLKTASIASSEFGSQIEKLPELLTIARAAAIRFGGTVEDRFQTLVQAVASGNTRALREIGLFVDAGTAIDKFALATGRARTELTQVAERQAVLNEVMSRGQKVFAGVDLENGSLAASSASVSVAFNEIHDTLALIANAAFGDMFQGIANGVAAIANALPGIDPTTPLSKIKAIDEALAKLTERKQALIDQSKTNDGNDEDSFFFPKVDPNFFKAKVDGVIEQMNRLEAEKAKIADSLKPGDREKLFNDSALKEQLEKTRKFQEQLRQINDETSKLKLENILASSTIAEQQRFKEEEAERTHLQKRMLITQQFAAETLLLDKQDKQFALDSAKLTDEQRLAAAQTINDKQVELARQKNALLAAEDIRGEQERLNILREMGQKQLEEDRKRQESALQITKQFYTGLVNVLVAGMSRVGASLREGGDAFSGFLGQVLNIMGDLAIQIGTELIVIGFGIDALKTSLLTLTGGTAIAAGLALVALGGLMKSFGSVNGAGASASPSTGTGGGITGGGGISGDTGPSTGFVPQEDQVREGPGTTVALTVQGNVMGTSDKSLALALTELLDDQFSSQGLTFATRRT